MRVVQQPEAAAPGKPVSKWELLRELSKAQATFGISERDLTVLQGLLSFFPDDALGRNADMVIFPSNKAICERLNGMPCSTMRRHIARLVDAGLLMRRDSLMGRGMYASTAKSEWPSALISRRFTAVPKR